MSKDPTIFVNSQEGNILVADSAVQTAKSLNEGVENRIATFDRRPFLSKLIYREEYKNVTKARANEIETYLVDKEKTAQMFRTAYMHSLENRLNGVVVAGGMQLDGQLQVVIAETMLKTKQEVAILVDKFIIFFDEQIDKLPLIKSEYIREKQSKLLYGEIDSFYSLTDSFGEKLKDLLNFRATQIKH